MSVKLKPLNEQVILITGASSGIGLLTAQTAAEMGAKVVLIARNSDALEQAVNDIKAKGGEATYAPADVADADAFRTAVEQGVAKFGRVDTWVNNAGVGMWAKLTESDVADDKRIFETNLWGLVNGSRLAVEYLRDSGGALINVGSVVSDVSIPLQGMYSASKHAVLGFTDALRIELQQAELPISVTLIKPAAIDTPFAQHAKNAFQRENSLPPPVYDPSIVASAILYAATHPRRELHAGGGARLFSMFQREAPSLVDWMLGTKSFFDKNFVDRPATDREGSLHETKHAGDVRGGVSRDRSVRTHSAYNTVAQHPVISGAVVTAAIAAVATYLLLDHSKKDESWSDRLWGYGEDVGDRLSGYGHDLGDRVSSGASSLSRQASDYASAASDRVRSWW